ncbi:bifunctional 2-polyprenyl-6-hydroxyphenol methylase/3-demethylubiquinol 3-O-methyltransferase UbiG [Pedobacter sp. L105]|uniref:class I SAM-dependent methyltransferase n=1 Tax=Pedobacter sp. L105 TaxID=1641871 RepID=UPI00131B31A3|nr:class I SAM-dependent methyltransferase [Pedobacter sp. L105]
MNNNYDGIARYYDVLSRMVFFRSQLQSQIHQLQYIPENSTILIAGGGTGWILEEIAKVHSKGLQITYVEISSEMLNLSRKRDVKANTVTYVHSSMEKFSGHAKYDVIFTAFFFDNFSAISLPPVFQQLHLLLNPGGLWLFSDFYYTKRSGKRWQSYLLKVMYLFFAQISNIDAKELINTEHHFEEHHYLLLDTAFYYGKFIKAIVYRKTEDVINN